MNYCFGQRAFLRNLCLFQNLDFEVGSLGYSLAKLSMWFTLFCSKKMEDLAVCVYKRNLDKNHFFFIFINNLDLKKRLLQKKEGFYDERKLIGVGRVKFWLLFFMSELKCFENLHTVLF